MRRTDLLRLATLAVVPWDNPLAPRSRPTTHRFFTPKQWRKRKRRMRTVRESRRLNR